MVRRRVLLGTLCAVLFGAGWWAGRGHASSDLYANLDVFVEVLHAVQNAYVDPVDANKLVRGGLQGMVRELDPYSEYMDERKAANFDASITGGYDGIGVRVDVHEGYPVVFAPLEGTPAWEAGLLPGDIITKIDGVSTQGLSLADVGTKLLGAPGTRVTLTIDREGESADRDVTMERRHVESKAVPYAFVMPEGVGYLRLATFNEHAGAEVRAALDTLRARGARSLVLDLRGNPGGLVDQAVEVLQPFVPGGSLVVSTKGRNPARARNYVTASGHGQVTWPMAVLVDGASASAAEIVAGALQDLDRALIVGSVTFGKGSVQSIYPLPEHGGALRLTTAYYFTPSGRSIHRAGPSTAVEDDGGDDTAPDSAATDSVPRPTFRTRAGRVVVGGGGIAPDVEALPDSLPPLARAAENDRAAFRFSGRWIAQHGRGAVPDSAAMDAFRAELRKQGLDASDAAMAAARPALERALEREFLRRESGAGAAARSALASDAVFQQAVRRLARARAPRDVFAGLPPAGAPGGAR